MSNEHEPTTEEWAVHPKQRAAFIRGFIEAVLHGNFEHREWLKAAGEAYISGKEIPKCPCQK